MLEVLVEQVQADALQRLADCRDLGEHVDAVGVFVDQALQAAHLALDALQARQHLLLVVRVSGRFVHEDHSTPLGYTRATYGWIVYARWVKFGLRFSRKAAMPSWASAVVAERDITSTAYA